MMLSVSVAKKNVTVKINKTVRRQKPERLRIDDPKQKTLKTARPSDTKNKK